MGHLSRSMSFGFADVMEIKHNYVQKIDHVYRAQYIYIYTYVFTYIHLHIYIYIHTPTYVYIHLLAPLKYSGFGLNLRWLPRLGVTMP